MREKLRAGARKLVLIAPCGFGKTVTFSEMAERAAKRGLRVIVICHRKELADQTVRKLDAFGIRAGVIMGNDPRRDSRLPVQVCSIQTLFKRLDHLPPADLVIYDEVHHALSNTSRAVLARYPDATHIGATATPWRADKLGLGDIYEGFVLAATPAELIASGELVPYDPFAYDAPDLHEVKVTAGEFNQAQLGLACNTDVLVGSVVREYMDHTPGRPALVFPVGIAHSQNLVKHFREAGFRAEHLDCKTKKVERERIIDGLRDGAVTIVSSVGVLTEGFDAPAAEVCILARPTLSLSLYIQMVGRVLRTSPETGKQRAIIHDHAGNILRHGFPDDERDYSLEATAQKIIERHTCPFCRFVFAQLNAGACPKCGQLVAHIEARPATESASDEPNKKRHVDGVRLDRAQIEALRGRLGRPDFSDAEAVRVATATPHQRAAELLRLRGVAERKGFKPGWVDIQYRQTFGAMPGFDEDFLATIRPSSHPFVSLPPRGPRAE
jgi:DNA repair protein RadD